MASAAKTTIDTNGATLFDAAADGGACSTIIFQNDDTNLSDVKVNVPGIHKAGEFDYVAPGDERLYRNGFNGITSLFAQADSDPAAVVRHSVVAKNA